MLDALLIIAVVLLGGLVRLPFLSLNLGLFEDGLPPGDMSGVMEKFDANSRRSFPNDHSIVSTDRAGTFGYPVLFHWLVSRFARENWRPVSVLLAIAPDLLLAILVYWLVRADLPIFGLTSPLQANGFAGLDALGAALAALVFLFQPGYLAGRMRATNGRTFGLFFFSAFLLSAYGAYVSVPGSAAFWLSAALMSLTTYALALSTLFGLQVIVFVGLVFGALLPSLTVIAAIAGTLAVTWLVRPLGVRDVVNWKIAHFFWYRENRKSMTAVDKRRLVSSFLAFWPALVRDRVRAKAIFLNDSPLLIALASFPAIIGFAVSFALSGFPTASPFIWFAACLFAATLPIFVLTSGPTLSELGEAERYWEYGSIFVFPSTVALLTGLAGPATVPAILLLVLVAEGCLLVTTHFFLLGRSWRLAMDFPSEYHEAQVVTYFQNAGIEPALAPLPQQMQRFWPRRFRDQGWRCRMFYLFVLEPGQPLSKGFPYMNRMFPDYIQVPSLSVEEFAREAKVDHVIAQKRFLASVAQNPYVKELQENYEPVYESAKYVVYNLANRKAGQTPDG